MVLKEIAERLKENYRLRRDNWKDTWRTFKEVGFTDALLTYTKGVGRANRALIKRA
jgi:hypothetical protein